MFAITLDNENRILRATTEQFASETDILVEELPDGDITEYKYVGSEYVYEPLPVPVPPTPTPTAEDDLNAMAVDHEYRITMLELGLTE